MVNKAYQKSKFYLSCFFSSIIPLLCYHLWWNKGFQNARSDAHDGRVLSTITLL